MAIFPGRFTARTDKPVVLFLIGMRINNFFALGDIYFMSKAMPAMLRELSQKKESGMLWYRQHLSPPYISVQQYWESFDKLVAYAHDKDGHHFPLWPRSTGASPIPAASASGTRPIWSSPASTNASTATCRSSVLPPRPRMCRRKGGSPRPGTASPPDQFASAPVR